MAALGTGSHFGEMAFIDGESRSASATALERTELIIVPYEKLKELANSEVHLSEKFHRELALFLCGRLRVTTSDLTFSREKNLSHF